MARAHYRIDVLTNHLTQDTPGSMNIPCAGEEKTKPWMTQLQTISQQNQLSQLQKQTTSRGPKKVAKRGDPEYVVFGWRIIREGETALVTDLYGQGVLQKGPQSWFLVRQYFELLTLISAHPNEYIAIEHKDGTKETIAGPASIYFNPVKHNSIVVDDVITINGGQAIVVYARDDKGTVATNVIHGPCVKVLQSNEWMHTFFWNIPNQMNPSLHTRQILRFNKLRTIPDQFYYNVLDVRTVDDAVITVKLMVFYHLYNVEKMLQTTHDPVSEIMNVVTADVIDFASSRTFEEFKQTSELLNRLETYKELSRKMDKMGYNLSKVVYRGYDASTALQTMHDAAIEKRTSLKLKNETEKQEQDLENFRLQCKQDRTKKELELDASKVEHEHKMLKIKTTEELQRQSLVHQQRQSETQQKQQLELAGLKKQNELEREHKKELSLMQEHHLENLHKNSGLDVTQYLVAKHSKVDKVVKIGVEKQ